MFVPQTSNTNGVRICLIPQTVTATWLAINMQKNTTNQLTIALALGVMKMTNTDGNLRQKGQENHLMGG